MDKHEDSRQWLKFFKDAGIPKKTGASYAHIFVENRIHNDMLPELTVDYLRLMGITLMGDIIAILRHCKSVHQDSVRKVVILQSKDEEVKQSSSSCSSSDDSSDDVEMIEVTKTSTKRVPASTKTIDSVKKEPQSNIEAKQVKSQIVGKITSSKPTSVSVIEKKTPAEPVKRKHDDESENISQEEPISKNIISSNSGKSKLKSTAPTSTVKKMRVTTENDIMGPKLPPPKKTVFERLGAETEPPQVSSTTELPPVETKFTRIISAVPLKSVNITSSEDISIHKASSVFKRLGGLKDGSQETKTVGPSLPYAGVLKSPPILKTTIRTNNPTKIIRGTMRADEPEVPVKLRAARNSTQNQFTIHVGESSLANRLKPQLTKAAMFRRKALNVDSEGIFARDSLPTSVSVKQRLGLTSNSGEESFTSSIKQRISRPVVNKHRSSYEEDEDDDGHLLPRSHVKRVSFGKVERKFISPAGSLRSSGFSRSNGRAVGVHSRLGTTRY